MNLTFAFTLQPLFAAVAEAIYAEKLMYVFWHNLGYDWVFMRRFMFEKFGFPKDQLNTRPLNPLTIQWKNGIIFKDSLALAQRSLDKWAKDLNVDTKKALGKWDYDKCRNQSDELSEDELLYIEHDVLAGVECIDVTIAQLHKTLSSLPLTATGIVRGECRNEGRKKHAHDNFFLKIQPKEYFIQQILELCFHGGYTHNNRHYIERIIDAKKDGRLIYAYDFASSYPFCMLAYKYPMERFMPFENCRPDFILANWAAVISLPSTMKRGSPEA